MSFFCRAKATWNDETGAVTVDWVALTASIVVMGIVVLSVVTVGSNYNANKIDNVITHGASTFLPNY